MIAWSEHRREAGHDDRHTKLMPIAGSAIAGFDFKGSIVCSRRDVGLDIRTTIISHDRGQLECDGCGNQADSSAPYQTLQPRRRPARVYSKRDGGRANQANGGTDVAQPAAHSSSSCGSVPCSSVETRA